MSTNPAIDRAAGLGSVARPGSARPAKAPTGGTVHKAGDKGQDDDCAPRAKSIMPGSAMVCVWGGWGVGCLCVLTKQGLSIEHQNERFDTIATFTCSRQHLCVPHKTISEFIR